MRMNSLAHMCAAQSLLVTCFFHFGSERFNRDLQIKNCIFKILYFPDETDVRDEEEDSVITAIMRARDKPCEKPPEIVTEDYLVDISFHPSTDIIVGASVTGDAVV